jgi:hypothetical protein
VTPSLQEVVGQALDDLEPGACRRGLVNLIALQNARLVGCWADGEDEIVAHLDGLAVAS